MKGTAHRTLRHRWHAPEKGTGPAFLISLAVHTMLFLAIAFVVRWKTEPAGPVSAELWSAPPPAVAPAPPSPPAPPPVRIERAPEPEFVKPDIVIEDKKPEKKVEPVKKVEPDPKVEQRKREEQARAAIAEQRKREEEARVAKEAQRKREEEAKAAKAAKLAAAEAEKRREVALARMTAAAGTPGGAASGGPGFSDSYKGQIAGCIKPHIAFNVPPGIRPGQHEATFEVSLLPTGEQVGAPRMIKSSGLPTYDQAVERAIRRCDPFPRPREGAMPRDLKINFDPVDTQRN